MDRDEELEEHYERYRKIIANMTMMSDSFARNVLKDKRCTEAVLRIILDDPTLEVIDQTVQADMKNLHGRSAILDCVATDATGRLFNVEVQQESEGASPKRARYYASLLDMNTMDPGEEFDRLPETYVIFVTRKDVLAAGEPIYHIERVIREGGGSFGDESHIVYVDASRRDDTELGRLMADFNAKRSADMNNGVLAGRVRELKETTKGVESMCKEMQEIWNEGRDKGRNEGREEGRMEEKKETTLQLAKQGLSPENIAKALRVDVDVIARWLAEHASSDRIPQA